MADTALLWLIINIVIAVLGVVIGLLLLYLVLRQAIFHGMRAHTRWIDEGKY